MQIRASLPRFLVFWLVIAGLAILIYSVASALLGGVPFATGLSQRLQIKLVTIPLVVVLFYFSGQAPTLRVAEGRFESHPKSWFSAPCSVPAAMAAEQLGGPLTMAQRLGQPITIHGPTGESVSFIPVLFPSSARHDLANAIRSLSAGPA